MTRRLAAAAVAAFLAGAGASRAQQPAAPIPLYPGAVPRSFEQQPLPPAPPGAAVAAPAPAARPMPAAPAATAAMSPPAGRVFCEQPVTVQLAAPASVPPRYRAFIGMWSDASWTPQLCAALIVESVTREGTASIVYVFGPMSPDARGQGGVLNGTGIIRDGELRFQNADGSQFAFRPFYADLHGHLTTAQGASYEAIFKRTL
jgi:hypothetical protein